jgi:taurine dioxygenase
MLNLEVDIKNATEDTAELVVEAILNHLIVVIRNQNLTVEEQVRFCKMIGEVENYKQNEFVRDFTAPISVGENILRVTGEKNEKGEEGLFGHTSTLDWHANQTSNKNRWPLIWLYAVRGSEGSRTSWINMAKAWEHLDEDLKEQVKTTQIICGYEKGRVSESGYFIDHVGEEPFDIYHKNAAGVEGMYFPFLQLFNEDPLFPKLKEHCLDPYFQYHHDWKDGDIVISEQWLSLHKRWEFDKMEQRLLHRIAFDYRNFYEN